VNTLLLVDGHSIAFRAFYALRAESFRTANGRYTNAVYGFTSTLLKILADHKPTHVAVAFDLPGGTFRTRRYPEYKGGRAKTPEEFVGQIELIQETLDVLGIRWLTVNDFEADDIIATLATKGRAADMRVYIASGDKDSFQLVGEQCSVLYPMPRSEMQELDPEGIVRKTGVSPEQYSDLAALVGESADNLPGVPGVGPKTAAKWIKEYGNLAGILAHADEIKGKAGESLRAHIGQVQTNRELNHLVTDLPIGEDLSEFVPQGVDRQAVHELFDTLDFTGLRTRVLQELPARDGEDSNTSDSLDLTVDLSERGFVAWLAAHREDDYGVYVESATAGALIAVAGHDNEVWCAESEELSEDDAQALTHWLRDGDAGKMFHDSKRARHILATALNAEIRGVVADTLLQAYLLYPDQREYDLEDLVLRHLGSDFGERADSDLFSQEGARRDGAVRAAAVRPLSDALGNMLAQRGEDGDLMRLELGVAELLFRMEQTGIAVDEPYLESLRIDFDARVETAARVAYEAIGHEVNLSSPKQLQTVLFDELRLPPTRKTKSGYTTNADALAELAAKIALREDDRAVAGQTFLAALLEHRDAIKLRQSVEGLQRSIADDGRVHTTYQQAVAATGRLSSTEPNLQNIHARTEEGRQIREAFIPEAPYTGLLTADYSQIEMRLMASLSGDSALIDAFRQGADLHTYVASRVFGVPESEIVAEQRSKIKAMSYGLAYGLSAFGLSRQLHIDVAEAQGLMDDYFSRFGKVRAYLDSLVERARRDGYTETILGRRRYLPELSSTNRQVRETAERMALNAPIQGSAADVIKLAMVAVARNLDRERLASRILLQVHDELVLEIAPGERERVQEIVREAMEGAVELDVPLSVGFGYGENWRAAAH